MCLHCLLRWQALNPGLLLSYKTIDNVLFALSTKRHNFLVVAFLSAEKDPINGIGRVLLSDILKYYMLSPVVVITKAQATDID